jgi:hypothetical protein
MFCRPTGRIPTEHLPATGAFKPNLNARLAAGADSRIPFALQQSPCPADNQRNRQDHPIENLRAISQDPGHHSTQRDSCDGRDGRDKVIANGIPADIKELPQDVAHYRKYRCNYDSAPFAVHKQLNDRDHCCDNSKVDNL